MSAPVAVRADSIKVGEQVIEQGEAYRVEARINRAGMVVLVLLNQGYPYDAAEMVEVLR